MRGLPLFPFLLLFACTTEGKAERFAADVSGIADSPPTIPLIEDLRLPNDPWLLSAIRSGDPKERERAALAMGRIQSSPYIQALVDAADHEEETSVLCRILFALGQMAFAESPPPDSVRSTCQNFLTDPEPEVQRVACEAIGKLAGEGAAEAITPLLQHDSPDIRAEAALALFRIRWSPVRLGLSKEPAPLPAESVRLLLQRMDDPSPAACRAAAYLCSRHPLPDAAPQLRELVTDPDRWTRLFAIRALGKLGDIESVPDIAPALQDSSEHVQVEAALALGRLRASSLVLPAVNSPSIHLRSACAQALASSPEDRTLAALEKLLTDPSPLVVSSALGAIASRKGEQGRETLFGFLRDDRFLVRVAVVHSAHHLGMYAKPLLRMASADRDRRMLLAVLEKAPEVTGLDDILETALRSREPLERQTAIESLGKGRHPRRLEWLGRLYEEGMTVSGISLRESIAAALVNDPDAEPFLRRISEDPAPEVRRKALFALRKQGLDVALPLPSARTEPSPFLDRTFESDPRVVLETSRGLIEILCFAEEAPIHVASFVDLVQRRVYDGLPWHRVVDNFVIQGGDPRGDGAGDAGYSLRDEINTLRFDRGFVGMPKGEKDTGGSQLFITLVPTPHLDGQYTLFGRVVEGMDVADRIDLGDVILRAWVKQP